MSFSRNNNFDLIRFLAALQVVLWHSYEHLKLQELPIIGQMISNLELFPGVPIFFFISGFLIYASYERNKSIKKYLKNRCLRIFPALWLVFILTFVILILLGFINLSNILSKEVLAWIITQISIFQFYTPVVLRGFGVGNPNGSLWTIFIEFSFYIAIPLFFLLKKDKKRVLLIIVFLVISLLYNFWYSSTYRMEEESLTSIQKLMGLNLLPYLLYFLIGVLFNIFWDKIKFFLVNLGYLYITLYILYYIVFCKILGLYTPSYWPNFYGFISILLMALVVFSVAFTMPNLSQRIFKGNDISYGVYLYHMPIINTLLTFNIQNKWIGLVTTVMLTVIIAI